MELMFVIINYPRVYFSRGYMFGIWYIFPYIGNDNPN